MLFQNKLCFREQSSATVILRLSLWGLQLESLIRATLHCLLLCFIYNNHFVCLFSPGTKIKNSQMALFIRRKFALQVTSNWVNTHIEAFESFPVSVWGCLWAAFILTFWWRGELASTWGTATSTSQFSSWRFLLNVLYVRLFSKWFTCADPMR